MSLSCYSQERLSKKVLSSNGMPLDDVNVYAPSRQVGVFTDKDGEFDMTVFSALQPTDTLRFSCVGYMQRFLTYGQLLQMKDVMLKEDTVSLREVVVTGEQEKEIFLPVRVLSSFPQGLFAFGTVLVDNCIYVQGGDESFSVAGSTFVDRTNGNFASKQHFSWKAYSKKLWVYDIRKDCWTQCPQEFSPRAYHTLLLHGRNLLAVGGKRLSTSKKIEWLRSDIDIYDLKRDTLIVDEVNPHMAADAASFVYGNQLIIMGGSVKEADSGYRTYSADIHVQDLLTGYWYEVGKMPRAMECKGVIWKRKIYLFGGFDGVARREVQSFDLATGKWRHEGELPEPMERPAVVVVGDEAYVYEAGKMLVYDFLSGQIRSYAMRQKLKRCELLTDGRRLYLIGGGFPKSGHLIASSSLYAVDLRAFERTVYE